MPSPRESYIISSTTGRADFGRLTSLFSQCVYKAKYDAICHQSPDLLVELPEWLMGMTRTVLSGSDRYHMVSAA